MRTRTALLLVALLPTLLLPPAAAAHVCFARGAWASVCSLHVVVATPSCCRACGGAPAAPRIGEACRCCGELAWAATADAAPPESAATTACLPPPSPVRVAAACAAPRRPSAPAGAFAAAPRPPPRLKPLLV